MTRDGTREQTLPVGALIAVTVAERWCQPRVPLACGASRSYNSGFAVSGCSSAW